MRNNKKGFTIIEIIVVIIIIAILALIAIPGIGRLIENGRANYNKNLEKELILMAKNYYADNKSKLPRGQLNEEGYPVYTTTVTLKELEEENYVTNEVVDAKKGSCEESYVYVENGSGGYEYYPCLACENYQSENAYCSLDNENIGTGTNPTCKIEYENYTPGEWTNKDIKATITGYHESGIPFYMVNSTIKVQATNNIGHYTIKESGSLVVEAYSRTGNKGICEGGTTKDKETGEIDPETEIKIEKNAPECASVVISPEGWQTSKQASITAKDSESGIKRISYGGTNLSLSGETKEKTGVATVRNNGSHEVEVEDNAGNIKICSFVVTGIDITPPSTSIVGSRQYSGGVINITFTATGKDSESGIEHYDIYYKLTTASTYTKVTKETSAESASHTITTTTGQTYNYYVETYDKVGNKGTATGTNISACGDWLGWSSTKCTVKEDICQSKAQYRTRTVGTTYYGCPNGAYLGPANRGSCVSGYYTCPSGYTKNALGGCERPGTNCGTQLGKPIECKEVVPSIYVCTAYSYNCNGVGGCGSAALSGESCYYYGDNKGAYCASGYTLSGTTCYGGWGSWKDGTCPSGSTSTTCESQTQYRYREGCSG